MLKKIAARVYRPLGRLFTVNPSETLKACAVFRNVLWVIAAYYGFLGVKGRKEVRFRNGARLRIDSFDDLSCLWECWVREEYPLSGAEATLIDAGANIGAFTLFAACRNPRARIVAFEPVAATFACLQENIRMNGLEGRVRVVRLGVAGSTAKVQINASAKSPYSSLYRDLGGHKEEIGVLGMADLLRETGWEGGIDFLKMDCEGSEVDCLMAADAESLRRFKEIQLEYHAFSGRPLQALEGKLREAGFATAEAVDNRDGTWMVRFHPATGTGS